MEISERKKKILAAVVDEYIATAEPISSKVIAPKLGFSSATIRNEMAELESMGYLEQPHTSAGRIPSAAGYRLYVNELMRQHKLTIEETETINNGLRDKMQQLDTLISDVGKLTSSLTEYPALAFAAPAPATVERFDLISVDPNTFILVLMLSTKQVKNKLIRLHFSVETAFLKKVETLCNTALTGLSEDRITPLVISSAERAAGDTMGLISTIVSFVLEVLTEASAGSAFVTGTPKLLQQPEFQNPGKAHQLMSYLSDTDKLMALPQVDGSDVSVIIGPENLAEELKDSSVIMASYDAGDNMRGLIGVVGPTRMDYSALAAKLSYIAAGLSKALSSGGEAEPLALQEKPHKGEDTEQ